MALPHVKPLELGETSPELRPVAEDGAVIHVDGIAERPNPGRAACAAVGGGRVLRRRLGSVTNNVAEYRAVQLGLRLAREMDVPRVIIHSDSQLVVYQVNGRWAVNNPTLARICAAVRERMAEPRPLVELVWVPRGENEAADAAAEEALAGVGDS